MKATTAATVALVAALAGGGVTWSLTKWIAEHEHGLGVEGSQPRPEGEHHEEIRQVTHFADRTELYLEHPPLVAGEKAAFVVHLTRLADFKPVSGGRISLVLGGGGAPEERFEADAPAQPGIFRLTVSPRHPGVRRLALRWEDGADAADHELGEVSVFPDAASEHAAHDHHDDGHAHDDGIVLTKERQWATDFATVPAARRPVRELVVATGTLRAHSDGEAVLHSPASGHLQPGPQGFPRVGMKVQEGQVLARLVPHLGSDSDLASLELNLAKARLALERTRLERERMEALFGLEAVPEKRLIAARSEERAAQAELSAAEARAGHYRESPAARGRHGGLPIEAPISGVVAEVMVVPGAFLAEGSPLLHVVDPSRMWLEARVPESELGRLDRATGGWFRVEGFPETFDFAVGGNARLVAVGGVVDRESRTVPVIFELAEVDRRLRIGMSARVGISVGVADDAVAVPVSAVVEERGRNVVFVQLAGERFARREVELGPRDGGWVAVRQGLRQGERVVSRGAYLVKLAGGVARVESHGHAH